MNVGLLLVSFGRAILALIDEVRRSPTWVVASMLAIVVVGIFLAQLAGH